MKHVSRAAVASVFCLSYRMCLDLVLTCKSSMFWQCTELTQNYCTFLCKKRKCTGSVKMHLGPWFQAYSTSKMQPVAWPVSTAVLIKTE